MMQQKTGLAQLATQFMIARGLEPEFPNDALEQAANIEGPAPAPAKTEDLRSLLWCSIDNDDSKDLDQLTYAEMNNGRITIWIAVADVSALVKKGSPIDRHAQKNTTSVYTPSKIFTMLPTKLSTDLTSLNEGEDRLAMVVKIALDENCDIENSSIFQAMVHNFAKLTYSNVGGWLEGKTLLSEKATRIEGLENALKLQSKAAQQLKEKRHAKGSLTLESSKAEARFTEENDLAIVLSSHNLAHQLIEEFMIAANHAMAQHFNLAKIANIRRVVRIPKYWDRIVEIARGYATDLPPYPDAKSLDLFLMERKKADPDAFPDLSLTIIKLLGRGEYIVENDPVYPVGHFALAINDYTHSTAPNRRYPDLVSQRQYKAYLLGEKAPYSLDELHALATHCTNQEDAATKVERQANKSAAALLLSSQIGTVFKGIITGIGEKGTWVRIFNPAAEGKLIHLFDKLKIGDKVSVQLKHVDIAKGYIDFAPTGVSKQ